MNTTPSIGQRLRERKLFQGKMRGRGRPPSSKYVDLDDTDTELRTESENHMMKGGRRSHKKMRGRGRPPSSKYVDLDEKTENESGSEGEDGMTKQNDLKRRGGFSTSHGVTKNQARRSHRKMHYDSSDRKQDQNDIRKCGEAHHTSWVKRADGVEVLCETKVCDLSMSNEARSRLKKGKQIVAIEESQESDGDYIGKDSGQSDSDTDVEMLYEEDAFGLRTDFKSKPRNNNKKRTASPELPDEHGMGYQNLAEKYIFEETDAVRGKRPACAHTSEEDIAEGMRNDNAGDDVNCHSLIGKNSNSGRRLQEDKSPDKNIGEIDWEAETKYFVRSTKKGSKVERTLTDTPCDSSHNSSTSSSTHTDSEDEDFKEENDSSSVSEESGSSWADEDDDEDSNSTEIKEKSDELGDQTSSFEHVMKETEKQAKYTCTIADEEAECARESAKKKKVKQMPRSEKSKPIHYDEYGALEYELNSIGRKRKRTSTKEGDGSCSGVHVDHEQESNTANHDQTCVENACHDTDDKLENLKGKKIEKQAKKAKVHVPKQNKFVNILINSIIGQGEEVFEEQATEPVQPSSPEHCTLPKKFRFEDEEPEPVEKSEEEKMVEALFDELVYADMYTTDSPEKDSKTENAAEANDKYAFLCSKGNHDLYIHEEIGLICRHCSHVEREIRYMDPEFGTNVRRETCTRRYVDREKLTMFNGLDFFPGEADFGEAFSASVGTVWDAIPGIKSRMYEHQQDGFEFLWRNLEGTINLLELRNTDSSQIGGCIISHAPGTGKTLLTIVFLRTYLKLFPSSRPMIIAPASMLLTWEEEFRKWQIDFPFHNVNNLEFSGKENKKLVDSVSASGCPEKHVIRLVKIYSWSKQKSILGISYSLFENLVGGEYRKKKGSKMAPKELAGEQSENFRKILLELPRLVVMDEGHTPRNSQSCIWNTLLKLQTNRKVILTGTPFQNNFAELFNTLRLVRPATAELLVKEKTFADMTARRRYYSKKEHKQKGTCFSSSRVEPDDRAIEKLKAVIAPFVHVHKGTILQRRLPGLRDSAILLNPRPRQRHLMQLIEDPRRHSSFDYDYKIALISTHPSLFKHCSSEKERGEIDMDDLEKLRLSHEEGAKTKFVMELVRLSCVLREKVLVFSQYTRIQELLAEQLAAQFGWEEGRHVIQMHGKQEQKCRQNIITKFNDPQSEAVVLLASTKCCSEGINLVGASRVVLLDVVWNPSVERQAISRAYRLGQQKIVHTYHLMASGTTEGDKYCRQVEKDRLSELVFSSTTEESERQKNPALDFDDNILQKMLGDGNFKGMFEKVIYQPKEANLIESFGLAPQNN